MPFNYRMLAKMRFSLFWRIVIIAFIWLALISWFHCQLNYEKQKGTVVHLGYMPVITNLAAAVLDKVTRHSEDIRFKALKFSSFAEMAEALRNGSIQAAFMIAPLSIVLHQQGEDVKVVYIGNRHESTLVTRKDLAIEKMADFVGKTIAVPMRYSGHNLSILKLLDEHMLTGKVNVVEMNPPDMASALSTGALDAYYVGEPFAAQTLKSGDARLFHYVEKVWPGFICNLVVVKKSFIDQNPKAVEKLVSGAARSGIWASKNLEKAADIAAEYWNQEKELVVYAMSTPPDRIIFDQFTPKQSELQKIADLMLKYDLVTSNKIDGLVDDRFAKSVELDDVFTLDDILAPTGN
jgi:NitT/TauT family transport system substrate-binding protein